jgi:hypothetical protein
VPTALEDPAEHLAVGRVVVCDQYAQLARIRAATRVVVQPHDAFAHFVSGTHRVQHVEEPTLVEGQFEHGRKPRGQSLKARHIRVPRHGQHQRWRGIGRHPTEALRELALLAAPVYKRAVVRLG